MKGKYVFAGMLGVPATAFAVYVAWLVVPVVVSAVVPAVVKAVVR